MRFLSSVIKKKTPAKRFDPGASSVRPGLPARKTSKFDLNLRTFGRGPHPDFISLFFIKMNKPVGTCVLYDLLTKCNQ
jgi:hypothetical protein